MQRRSWSPGQGSGPTKATVSGLSRLPFGLPLGLPFGLAIGLLPFALGVGLAAALPALGPGARSQQAQSGAAMRPLPLRCTEGLLELGKGDVRAENNAWGKGSLQNWRQCIGLEPLPEPAHGVRGRWTWDWPDAGGRVKAYPELIVGTKPGSAATTPSLPRRLSQLTQLQAKLSLDSNRNGSGNLAFDLWLTNSADVRRFGVPPISHELMVWRDAFGAMQPAGQWRATVKLEGRSYDLYVNEQHGDGWRYIAYIPRAFAQAATPALAPPGVKTPRAPGRFHQDGVVNLRVFLADAQARNLVGPAAYLASVELGNELISGQGETRVHHYSLVIR